MCLTQTTEAEKNKHSIINAFVFSSRDDSKPWIQVDFQSPKLLSGVLTQGENGGQRWLTRYTVETSMDGTTFTPYSFNAGDNEARLFRGNFNNHGTSRHLFNRNITAQYIRIYPVAWHGASAAFRFNILGCNPDIPQTPTVTTEAPVTTMAPNASFGTPTTEATVTGSTSGFTVTTPAHIPPSCKFFTSSLGEQQLKSDHNHSIKYSFCFYIYHYGTHKKSISLFEMIIFTDTQFWGFP